MNLCNNLLNCGKFSQISTGRPINIGYSCYSCYISIQKMGKEYARYVDNNTGIIMLIPRGVMASNDVYLSTVAAESMAHGVLDFASTGEVISEEGKAAMTAAYECYTVPSGSGGKKDDKWYFEAWKKFGKIKINTERMDETQAVEAMKV